MCKGNTIRQMSNKNVVQTPPTPPSAKRAHSILSHFFFKQCRLYMHRITQNQCWIIQNHREKVPIYSKNFTYIFCQNSFCFRPNSQSIPSWNSSACVSIISIFFSFFLNVCCFFFHLHSKANYVWKCQTQYDGHIQTTN